MKLRHGGEYREAKFYEAEVRLVFCSVDPINQDDVRAWIHGFAEAQEPVVTAISKPRLLISEGDIQLGLFDAEGKDVGQIAEEVKGQDALILGADRPNLKDNGQGGVHGHH